MKSLLVCHSNTPLNEVGLSRWLASFSELSGVVILEEGSGRRWKRIMREVRRIGLLRMADVLAYRLWERLLFAKRDRMWVASELERLKRRFAAAPADVPILRCANINSSVAEEFIRGCSPDILILRCKQLLAPRIFSLPRYGSYVFHPGICPQYRNAHGCFWALARGDRAHVGMTLLRVDSGIDTGPIYGYYSYDYDERVESPFRIQQRVVFANLDRLRERLQEIHAGTAQPIDPGNVDSATWGQPWLSVYWAYRWRARRRMG